MQIEIDLTDLYFAEELRKFLLYCRQCEFICWADEKGQNNNQNYFLLLPLLSGIRMEGSFLRSKLSSGTTIIT